MNPAVLALLAQKAKQADVVVAAIGRPENEGEDQDRRYELGYEQEELVRLVASANPKTVVVLLSGGDVDKTRWIDKVPAVLHAWYPGQEGGRAIGEIITGAVNPSGKLPVSCVKRWEDHPAAPYFDRPEDVDAGKWVYGEGIFVGYRGAGCQTY